MFIGFATPLALTGGGFVAGVTMAVAFILQYMARGTVWVEARLRDWRQLAPGLGLRPEAGVRVWLLAPRFRTESLAAARAAGGIALAAAHSNVIAGATEYGVWRH